MGYAYPMSTSCFLPLHAPDCECGDESHGGCEGGCKTILCLEPQGYPAALCHGDYPRATYINEDGHAFCSECAPAALALKAEDEARAASMVAR